MFSALAWLAGVVSLNDLRLSPNLPRDNFKTAVASDGKIQSCFEQSAQAYCPLETVALCIFDGH